MNIPSRVLNLSHRKQTLLSNRLRSDFGLSLGDDLKVKKSGDSTDKNPKRLVAYVVLDSRHKIGSDFDVSELHDFLKNRLPDYMMPSSFTFLEKLPRNSNGKVNYHALPKPNLVSIDRKSPLDLARTPTERELKKIWAMTLGIDQIGTQDNFFNIGGHSLLVAKIVSQIRSTFGVHVALRSLFDYPTIETLGEAIDTLLWTKKQSLASSRDSSSHREKFEI